VHQENGHGDIMRDQGESGSSARWHAAFINAESTTAVIVRRQL
jgi:hypothetical protein